MSVAFTVLHIAKYGTHAILSMTENTSLHRIDLVAADLGDDNSGGLSNRPSSTVIVTVYNPLSVPLDPTVRTQQQQNQLNNNTAENGNNINAPLANNAIENSREPSQQCLLAVATKSELLQSLKVLENAVLMQGSVTRESTEPSTSGDVNKNNVVLDVELCTVEQDNRNSSNEVTIKLSSTDRDIESGKVIQTPSQQPE